MALEITHDHKKVGANDEKNAWNFRHAEQTRQVYRSDKISDNELQYPMDYCRVLYTSDASVWKSRNVEHVRIKKIRSQNAFAACVCLDN